ncbi:hypothetical protein bcere0011_8130 [Bacillus cereus m1550]|nr:hypothetical protein bcere0011_8130 [Bacillus cereus m1550]
MPIDRILFKTDGPFAKYSKKMIYPSSLSEIYSDFEKVISSFKEHVYKNFRRLLIEKDLYI